MNMLVLMVEKLGRSCRYSIDCLQDIDLPGNLGLMRLVNVYGIETR